MSQRPVALVPTTLGFQFAVSLDPESAQGSATVFCLPQTVSFFLNELPFKIGINYTKISISTFT